MSETDAEAADALEKLEMVKIHVHVVHVIFGRAGNEFEILFKFSVNTVVTESVEK